MNNEIKEILEELRKTADNSIFVVCSSQEELDKIPRYTANFLSINDSQAKILLDYITNLQEKVNQYENPDDLTLFYMWLDEKAKDKMKKLQEENEDLREKNKEAQDFDKTMKDIKDNLIARINRQEKEIEELKAQLEMYENGVYFSSENDELQEKIDKAIEYIDNNTLYSEDYDYDDEDNLQFQGAYDYKAREDLLEILEGNKWNEVERAYLDDKPIGSDKE